MRLAIIGAGLAGLACAERLRARGLEARLFDKGKGPSGRLASRRIATHLGEAVFDMGAQYFTVRDRDFAAQVAQWLAKDLVAPWPEAGSGAWVGVPTMAAPLKAMAANHDIRWNTFVGGVSREGRVWRLHLKEGDEAPFDAVIIALPAEQAMPLLALNDIDFMNRSAASVSQPCWTGLFAFDAPLETSSPFSVTAASWPGRPATPRSRTAPAPRRGSPRPNPPGPRRTWSAPRTRSPTSCWLSCSRLPGFRLAGPWPATPIAGGSPVLRAWTSARSGARPCAWASVATGCSPRGSRAPGCRAIV